MNYPFIKICGLKDVETAVKAVKLGADFIGLVFHPQSKRHVDMDTAARIAEAVIRSGAYPVAVIVEQNSSQIIDICQRTKIRHVQFHGETAIKSMSCIKDQITKILCVKVNTNGVPIISDEKMLSYINKGKDYLLYDNEKPGSGERFNLKQFSPIHGFKYFIAGGLNADNVSEIISRINPNAVDVSSGVESQPGIKDIEKIRIFINTVKNARLLDEQKKH